MPTLQINKLKKLFNISHLWTIRHLKNLHAVDMEIIIIREETEMIIVAMILEDVDILHAKTINHVAAQMSRNVIEVIEKGEEQVLIDLIIQSGKREFIEKRVPGILNLKQRKINNVISSDYLIKYHIKKCNFVYFKKVLFIGT